MQTSPVLHVHVLHDVSVVSGSGDVPKSDVSDVAASCGNDVDVEKGKNDGGRCGGSVLPCQCAVLVFLRSDTRKQLNQPVRMQGSFRPERTKLLQKCVYMAGLEFAFCAALSHSPGWKRLAGTKYRHLQQVH